jgi:hypothetical protein
MLRMNPYRRTAIGLVELMVAMALTIGIMWILAESFKTGLDMTRELKSTTQMVNHLDGARAIMTSDLSKEHFLRDENKPGGGVRLSQQRLDLLTRAGTGWSPPTAGFFRILSPLPTITAVDSDGFSMNTATTCALHFTSILPPTERNLYTVKAANGNTYTSRAAEIAYFLVATNATTPGGSLLYKLHRRQRLVALTRDERSQLIGGVAHPEVIAGNGTDTVYVLGDPILPDVREQSRRLTITPSTMPGGGGASQAFGPGFYEGTDLLLSDVLSFEVQVDWAPNTAGTPAVPADDVPGSTLAPRTTAANNWDWPFDSLAHPGGNAGHNTLNANGAFGVFDTWYPYTDPNTGLPLWNIFGGSPNTTTLPLAVRVKQLRIILRIFDKKTMQTRQSSFVVEM